MAIRHTKQSHRLQRGRHVRSGPPPDPKARKRAAIKRRLDKADGERRRKAEQAQLAEAKRRADREAQRIAVAEKRAAWAGLSDLDATKLVNVVKNRPDDDVYLVIRDWLARNGHGVRVPSTSPLDAARPLPTPPQEGKAPPPGALSADDEVARAEQARRAQERARRLEEQNRRDRDAYDDALARHGLTRPEVGYPTGSGTSGFGH